MLITKDLSKMPFLRPFATDHLKEKKTDSQQHIKTMRRSVLNRKSGRTCCVWFSCGKSAPAIAALFLYETLWTIAPNSLKPFKKANFWLFSWKWKKWLLSRLKVKKWLLTRSRSAWSLLRKEFRREKRITKNNFRSRENKITRSHSAGENCITRAIKSWV